MATVSSRGGLATVNPLENPTSMGMGRAMGLAQQAMGLPYVIKNIQADLALKQAQAGYYGDRGSYYDQYGNLKSVQAQNQSQGTSGSVGQQVLLAQNILNNPSATDSEKQFANATLQRTGMYGSGGLPNNLTTQGWQAGVMQQNANASPNSPFGTNGINQSPSALFQTEQDKIKAQIEANQAAALKNKAEATIGIPATAASNVSGAQEKITNAVNNGSPFGYDVTPDLNKLQNQMESIKQSQQSLPQGNYTNWDPQQQANYIANNDRAPPVNGPITNKVDPKTEARMNGLAPSATSLVYLKQELSDPEVQQYIGKQGPQYLARAAAEFKRTGEVPPSYTKYLAMQNTAATFIADTVASTQTGSRSFGMMQQFQKVFNPKEQMNLQQALESVSQAGQILYDEGNTYVGGPYAPGLRDAAFNGVKILQKGGFGPQPTAQGQGVSSGVAPAASTPPPGLSREQFMQWMQQNGGK